MAGNTDLMGFKVDFLTFTAPDSKDGGDSPENFKLLKNLGYDYRLFEETQGRFFFNSGITLNNYFSIFYNAYSKKLEKYTVYKHMYSFTGVGCTDLDGKIHGKWLIFLKALRDSGCKITRIDLALDDFGKHLNFDLIEKKLNAQEFKSSKKSYNVVKKVDTSGVTQGRTIYIGARQSSGKNGNYFLRMYDKLAEYRSKRQILPLEAEKSGSWQRYELQFNKAKAVGIVDLIIEKNSIAEAYYSVLADTVTFLEPTKTKNGTVKTNKSRWEVSPWWDSFLQGTEKAKLRPVQSDFDLGTLLQWVRVAVVPSLQVLQEAFAGKGYDFYQILEQLPEIPKNSRSKKQQKLLLDTAYMSDKTFLGHLKDFIGKEDDEESD